MENLQDPQTRLIILFGWLFVLYSIEFVIPLTRSSRSSVLSTVPNIIMMIIVLLTNLIFTSAIFFAADLINRHHIGLFYYAGITNFYVQLIIGILFMDFWAAYLSHRVMHWSGWLWRFHSVHHSDTMVDVTTSFRQHPMETILRVAFQISGMFILGLPLLGLLTYLSLSAFWAQVEHSNIALPKSLDRLLQYIFATPNMHKLHHSKYVKETDSNYSNIFSVWDKLFGTYRKRENYNAVEYGLDYLADKDFSVKNMLVDIPLNKTIINAEIKETGHAQNTLVKTLFSLLLIMLLATPVFTQEIHFCLSYTDSGEPMRVSNAWNVDAGGGYLYVLYKQSSEISMHRYSILISEEQDGNFVEVKRYSIIPDSGKNWVAVYHKVFKPGDFKVSVLEYDKPIVSDYLTIIPKKTPFLYKGRIIEDARLLYYDTKVITCQTVSKGKPINPSMVFALAADSIMVSFLILNNKGMKHEKLNIDIYKKASYSEEVLELVESKRIRPKHYRDNIYFNTVFTQPGEYEVYIYDQDQVWINTRNITICSELQNESSNNRIDY